MWQTWVWFDIELGQVGWQNHKYWYVELILLTILNEEYSMILHANNVNLTKLSAKSNTCLPCRLLALKIERHSDISIWL